jgi:BlaI family penicillinase repressor
MPKELPHITAAEFRILKVLWPLGSGTVRDVQQHFEDLGESPAYTTVMTLMNQLAAKGALKVDKSRQPYVYRPAVRRDQVLGQRLRQFLETVFDGQAGELVMRLVEESDLSPEELKRIERKIERREQAADEVDAGSGEAEA